MKEDFLHYLWKFQKFSTLELITTEKETLQVLKVGSHNTELDGPDFLIAQILIDNQKWAGNVEIHIKSSDWYAHNHQVDTNYDSVILHVVWEHDVEVYRSGNSKIPTLELKNYVSTKALKAYKHLYDTSKKRWINCENQLYKVSDFVWENWLERLYFERLEEKSKPILQLLKENKNNWEATCFCLMAKAFGGNTNGDTFFSMAKSIPFNIIQKETSFFKLEAMFMGQCNMLKDKMDDPYAGSLYKEYSYLKKKYNLIPITGIKTQFFRLRPYNFPTIRLSQLAVLYTKNSDLFNVLNQAKTMSSIQDVFSLNASEYWNTHYNFGVENKIKVKKITDTFVSILLLNSIIPLRFLYMNTFYISNDIVSELKSIIELLKPEKNNIVDKYKKAGVKVGTCIHSQALLTLNKNYCKVGKCLKCSVGNSLLGI